eukprot:gb/GEZJ01002219.1/.p1 GENE.gb/GEZJ01002219.1/~~gb/GEZJ01002219.1/.p1  ORF type:complete len:499 (-),score=104.64 gb/GEZJ01002219.1/:4163-5659(-)
MMSSTEELAEVAPQVQEPSPEMSSSTKQEAPQAPSPTDVSAHRNLSTESPGSTEPASKGPTSDSKSGEGPERTEEMEEQTQEITLDDIRAAADQIDENIDNALGHAADTLWSFASSVRGTMSSVVSDESGLANLRKNVTSHLAPLDDFGRGIQSQIGALAPKDVTIANITGSMRSVAQSVQRNAQAVEDAILAKANEPVTESQASGASQVQRREASSLLAGADDGMDILSVIPSGEGIEVNQDIARVGKKVSEKVGGLSHAIGETVGGLLTGLLGTENDEYYEEIARRAALNIPKTRFEKRIYELQANPDTYCEQPTDIEAFNEWGKDFDLEEYAESCIEILYTHETISDLYEQKVPNIIDDNTFWKRYFFARDILRQEEERRRKLLSRAETAETEGPNEEEGWGDDDWGEDENQANEAPEMPTSMNELNKDTLELNKESSSKGDEKDNPETDLQENDVNVKHSTASKVNTTSTDIAKKIEEAGATPEDDDWGVDDWE